MICKDSQAAQDTKIDALETSQDAQDLRLDALEGAGGPDLSGYVEKAGDAMTGTLQINGALDNKIDPLLCRADGYYMSFGVAKNGDVFAGASTSNPFLATENWHVVTKAYLDQAMPVVGPAKYAWRHRRVVVKSLLMATCTLIRSTWRNGTKRCISTQRHGLAPNSSFQAAK